ncbi:MAG: hypothetical protein FRX48_03763 [Lasallia pustulata]|uniref:Uncharacterized protein n=1 Tax=Lasallia pustulata TaxID=136370 RepID=A0A5M8PVR1_9LECA|nr:MAG: hypothetical protein FRX48_03763 [Lasallia pustulata]
MRVFPPEKEPNEFAREEDDFGAGPGRSDEEVEAREGGFDVRDLYFERGQLDGLELEVRDAEPGDAASMKQMGVMGGTCCRLGRRSGQGRVVHVAERSDVAAANVFGDDAADRFDHTVSYTADAVDGDDVILVVIAVVGEVVGLVGFEPSLRLDVAACRVINDQEDGGKEPINKWRGRDGADALKGLIETGQETDSFEGPCCNTDIALLLTEEESPALPNRGLNLGMMTEIK